MPEKPTDEELEKRIRDLEQAGFKHKRTCEALKESEEQFKALSEAAFEAIFLSVKGICVDQNQTAERMFGYTRAEAVGRHGTEWIALEDRAQVHNSTFGNDDRRQAIMCRRRPNSRRRARSNSACPTRARHRGHINIGIPVWAAEGAVTTIPTAFKQRPAATHDRLPALLIRIPKVE